MFNQEEKENVLEKYGRNILEDAKAVMTVGLFGERGSNSLAKLIYGEVSPSGRLAETYPISHRKVSSFYTFANDIYTTAYEEGIFVIIFICDIWIVWLQSQ